MDQSKYTEKNKEMKKRVVTLDEECKNLVKNGSEFQYIQKSKLDHLIVDDRYKVIYCYVPKVACTNLKRVFLLLTGKMNVSDPLMLKSGDVHAGLDKYLTYLDTFPPAGIKYRFLHYKKVIFVREPFERILSAYRNKFLQNGNSYFKEKFGKKIIKRYRQNPSTDSLDKGNDVTFKEFVQYLLNRKTMEQGYNEHWETFHNLCHPCHIRYNYVGKYESLDDDVDGLLKILKVDDKIHFPARADMYKTLKTEDTLLKFYKGIKPEMLTKLWNVYAKDYNVFDYEVPPAIKKLMKPVL
ncbi:carbohydrate sulfotransferase 11-like isoform X2 [Ruditapes philippinarum]|uniref:carbohydrate sulfotransferase 11-like isoform X2 n=1 Tax=Ruditapes philippinarum TaxID=129788 RepID=UPI00295AEB71|nr:carbohydrate sulfotransferase 11-like isoform X2 [Ruditapes philippinarum]